MNATVASEVNAYELVRQARWGLFQYLRYVDPFQPTVLVGIAKQLERAEKEMFDHRWEATRKAAPAASDDGQEG